jgi:ketosteroid isomerase-like protein
MSQENVEIVRRGFEAWERGDWETHLSLLREDVVCCRVAPLIDPRDYNGLEGYLEFATEWLDPYDEVSSGPASSSMPATGSWWRSRRRVAWQARTG